MNDVTRPGRHQLDGFRGNEPKPGDPEDPAISPPVADDPAPDPGATDDSAGDPPPEPQKKDDDGPKLPPKPPSDLARDKIAARFESQRNHDPDPEPPSPEDDPPPAAPGKKTEDDQEPPETGVLSSKDPDPKAGKLALKIDGQTIEKTIDEIAVLADLTPEEVRASPQAAIRIAQREVASTKRLEDSKRILRETRQNTDDADPQPARPAPHQEQPKAGKKDGSDKSGDSRDTSGDVDPVSLVESIQMDDPKEAGAKLLEVIERVAESKATAKLSESDTQKRLVEDRRQRESAMQAFAEDHKEIGGNQYVASAIASALVDEYREDLSKAMRAEGRSEDEIEEAFSVASPSEIAQAHFRRRVTGDANVRPISKDVIESAYSRVQKALGVQQTEQRSNQQDFSATRETRKEALPSTPKRASAPPAANNQPRKEPISRSSVVAEMRAQRGQRA